MGSFLSGIFERLSVSAAMLCLFVLLTLGGTMWGLAHWAAEPGTPVKALFGLMEYTKSAIRPPAPTSRDEQKAGAAVAGVPAPSSQLGSEETAPEPKPPRTIEVVHGVEPDNAEKFLSATRERLAVRELSPMETGNTLGEAPKGTRFYIPTAWLRRIEGPQPMRELEQANIFKESYRNLAFEAYRLETGETLILAFTTEVEAVGVRNLSGRVNVKFVASPMPWGASSSALLVPANRIVSMRSRELEIGGGSRVHAADTVLQ